MPARNPMGPAHKCVAFRHLTEGDIRSTLEIDNNDDFLYLGCPTRISVLSCITQHVSTTN